MNRLIPSSSNASRLIASLVDSPACTCPPIGETYCPASCLFDDCLTKSQLPSEFITSAMTVRWSKPFLCASCFEVLYSTSSCSFTISTCSSGIRRLYNDTWLLACTHLVYNELIRKHPPTLDFASWSTSTQSNARFGG